MKKILLILTLFVGVTLKGEAQHFTASFGVSHSWDVPVRVTRVIGHDYYGYDMVHATQIRRHGGLFFDVVLQRGDVFVEVSVRHDGYIMRSVSRNYYPLHDHVCSNYCGYHSNYYNTYYRDCHSHNHHGHNHVVYVNRPQGHGHGHGHGHKSHYVYKGDSYHHNNYSSGKHNSHKNNHKHDRDDNYRERRSTYHEEKKHSNGRGNGHGNNKGRVQKNSRSNSSGTYVRRTN